VINCRTNILIPDCRRLPKGEIRARKSLGIGVESCQRTIRKVQDEEVQKIINGETERRLLAAYIHGLKGIVGQQVQFQMPTSMEQTVKLAVTVENVEKHTDGWGFEEGVC
jgi:hypothetical protein